MKFCPQCGQHVQNVPGRFCMVCGAEGVVDFPSIPPDGYKLVLNSRVGWIAVTDVPEGEQIYIAMAPTGSRLPDFAPMLGWGLPTPERPYFCTSTYRRGGVNHLVGGFFAALGGTGVVPWHRDAPDWIRAMDGEAAKGFLPEEAYPSGGEVSYAEVQAAAEKVGAEVQQYERDRFDATSIRIVRGDDSWIEYRFPDPDRIRVSWAQMPIDGVDGPMVFSPYLEGHGSSNHQGYLQSEILAELSFRQHSTSEIVDREQK